MAGGRSLPVYTTGTVAVSSAGVVTGTGTNFIAPDGVANYTLVGGDLFLCGGEFGVVGSVASATSLTLDFWTGGAVSAGASYKIYRFEGQASNAIVALVNSLLSLGSDANPKTAEVVDTGAVRFKLDDDGSGNMRLRVRPSGASDSAYVTALLINDATGATTEATTQTGQLVVDDGSARSALTEVGGVPTLAVGAHGVAVGSLIAALQANKTTGAISFPSGAYAPGDWQNNRVINGGLDNWFNGTSFTLGAGALIYTAEQWLVGNQTAAATLTAQKLSGVAGISSRNCLQVYGNVLAANDAILFMQRFEAAAVMDLAGSACSLSFDLYATTTAGTLTAFAKIVGNTAYDNGTFSNSSANVVFTVPATAGRVNIPLPSSVTALFANGASLNIKITLAGSSGNVQATLGGVSLEKGLVANPWAPKPPAREMADCQRFFQSSWPNLGAPASAASLWMISPGISIANGNQVAIMLPFATPMRASPTITLYDTTGASGKISAGGSLGLAYSANGDAYGVKGLTNNSGATLAALSNMNFHFGSSARL